LEETLIVIRACIDKSPAPWPQTWQREYVDAIHQTLAASQEFSRDASRLQIVRSGFPPYWESLRKGPDHSLFEVHLAQIRWFLESLLKAELAGADDRQKLRDQYRDLVEYAARSLLAQFPFLDPNAVEAARADHLAQCCQEIDAPLLPIFRRPLSEDEVRRITERWHDLRYARVDVWRQLGGDSKTPARSAQAHPHYLLIQRTLGQLRAQLWSLIVSPPDYYREAVRRELDAQIHRVQARAQMRNQERRLERTALRTECVSFLLTALLETAQDLREFPGGGWREEDHGEQSDSLPPKKVMPMR
jgi:hypothetical protein